MAYNSPLTFTLPLTSKIKRGADRCVMCGLCLPHCPTYLKTRDEGESPRGRIALMHALVSGKLELSARLEEHLDHCLVCRACEAVCPSGVPYGDLIDAVRAEIEQRRQRPWPQRLARSAALDGLIARKPMLRAAGGLLRAYQRAGVRRLARRSGLLRWLGVEHMDALLPALPPRPHWRDYHPPHGKLRGRVALFTGCIAELLDVPTLQAAINVLNRLGMGVHVPRGQVCCGALHLHNGAPDRACRLAAQNLAAFGSLDVDAVISVASGCGAQLREYDRLACECAPVPNGAERFARSVQDVSQFLAGVEWPTDIVFTPLPARIAVHDPCSLTHVLHRPRDPYAVLGRIPGIELLPLPDNARCCGAAGSYVLTQTEMAQALLADKLSHLQALAPDILVTSNIGCALHLTAGIREAGLNIEVLHPVVLLKRQLRKL